MRGAWEGGVLAQVAYGAQGPAVLGGCAAALPTLSLWPRGGSCLRLAVRALSLQGSPLGLLAPRAPPPTALPAGRPLGAEPGALALPRTAPRLLSFLTAGWLRSQCGRRGSCLGVKLRGSSRATVFKNHFFDEVVETKKKKNTKSLYHKHPGGPHPA